MAPWPRTGNGGRLSTRVVQKSLTWCTGVGQQEEDAVAGRSLFPPCRAAFSSRENCVARSPSKNGRPLLRPSVRLLGKSPIRAAARLAAALSTPPTHQPDGERRPNRDRCLFAPPGRL